MIKLLKRNRHYRILFYIATAVVFFLALSPSGQLDMDIRNGDKILHALAFFVLSLLLNRASSTIQHRIRNMLALLLFGGAIEVAQSFTAYRNASFNDLLADLVGILLFQLLYSLLRFRQQQRKKSK